MDDLSKLTLDEMIKDRAENARDIKMFQLMIEGHWTSVSDPKGHLAGCLAIEHVIDKELERRGYASVPA